MLWVLRFVVVSCRRIGLALWVSWLGFVVLLNFWVVLVVVICGCGWHLGW